MDYTRENLPLDAARGELLQSPMRKRQPQPRNVEDHAQPREPDRQAVGDDAVHHVICDLAIIRLSSHSCDSSQHMRRETAPIGNGLDVKSLLKV
jgi:hypothetical protein